jgi:hypothetical protein
LGATVKQSNGKCFFATREFVRNADTSGKDLQLGVGGGRSAWISARYNEAPTRADFTYSITPDAVSITDTGQGRASVTRNIEAVLRKIEYWHQGSIATFKIMYRGERGVWSGVSKTVDAQNS